MVRAEDLRARGDRRDRTAAPETPTHCGGQRHMPDAQTLEPAEDHAGEYRTSDTAPPVAPASALSAEQDRSGRPGCTRSPRGRGRWQRSAGTASSANEYGRKDVEAVGVEPTSRIAMKARLY